MRAAVGALAVLLSAGLALGAKAKLPVRWSEAPIVVDGEISEWQGKMTYVEGEGVFVALRNDGDSLYFCLHSRDPAVNHTALTRGLILRLEPQGGSSFGVRFPVGMTTIGLPVEGIGYQEFQLLADESLQMFELLGPGKEDVQRFTVDSGTGIEIGATVTRNELAYELRVPLRTGEGRPFAIGVEPGSRISLLLQTPHEPRPASSPRSDGPPTPGKGMGGSDGFGGMDGGMGDVERLPEAASYEIPLKIKAKVTLASDPS